MCKNVQDKNWGKYKWKILFKALTWHIWVETISLYLAAKSQLREVLDDMAAKSKVKLNYELPDEVVEDYTYEMGRLKFKVTRNLYLSFCFRSS